jgi:hypothetical protein
MDVKRARLYVAAGLFLGWLTWLFYLVLSTTRPIVLSRAQLLVSTVDVIAHLNVVDGKPDPRVGIVEVHWPQRRQIGPAITVTNFGQCNVQTRDGAWHTGSYILPLIEDHGNYRVAEIPASPGYDPNWADSRPRVYEADRQTRHQLNEIRKPRRKLVRVPWLDPGSKALLWNPVLARLCLAANQR